MMTIEEAIELAERKGLFWTICRVAGGYSAAVRRTGSYVGNSLSGPGVREGSSPAEALANAIKHEHELEGAQRGVEL